MTELENYAGEFRSPGGFVFGVQGWQWGDQRPTSITFFLDGSARVCDQHGRPIKGFVHDGKPIYMEKLTHAQVIQHLKREFPWLDWKAISWAGWPQLPYAQLKELPELPPTPAEELYKIKDASLRKDALRVRREVDAERAKEAQAQADD